MEDEVEAALRASTSPAVRDRRFFAVVKDWSSAEDPPAANVVDMGDWGGGRGVVVVGWSLCGGCWSVGTKGSVLLVRSYEEGRWRRPLGPSARSGEDDLPSALNDVECLRLSCSSCSSGLGK